MRTPTDAELLAYMRSHKLAVVSTVDASGSPQAALVGVATTEAFDLIFDSVSTSRKHANLMRDPRAAVTFGGPAEQTLQFEGLALPVSTTDPADAPWREAYYRAWPECRDHLACPPSPIGASRRAGCATATTTAGR